jgi:FKBP-type peptidyl-prolyl cis-trans isomerase FkpA
MLPGFRDALVQMQRGGTYVAEIPAAKAYGDTPPEGAPIPPGADLTFTIDLIDFMPADEFEGRVQAVQQLLAQEQMMGSPAGSEGAAPPAPPPAANGPQ